MNFNKRTIRLATIFAAILALAGVFWYFWSPFSTVARLERAILDDNRVVVRELIDFPRVRESIVEAIVSEIIKTGDDTELLSLKRQEIDAQIKARNTPAALVLEMRDSVRTREQTSYRHFLSQADEHQRQGIIKMRDRELAKMDRGDFSDYKLYAGSGKTRCCDPVIVRGFNLYYKSPNLFVVNYDDTRHVFERQGLFSWRMIEHIRRY